MKNKICKLFTNYVYHSKSEQKFNKKSVQRLYEEFYVFMNKHPYHLRLYLPTEGKFSNTKYTRIILYTVNPILTVYNIILVIF